MSPFDYGNDFVSLLNVKALVRLDDLPCLLIHPIDGDMKVIVVSIEVQAVHCLMPLQTHAFQKHIDNFFYLFPRRLFSLLPREYPVLDRHSTMCRFIGQRNHFTALPSMSGRPKISSSCVLYLLLRISIVRESNVIHKVTNLPRLGLPSLRSLNLFYDHGRQLLFFLWPA